MVVVMNEHDELMAALERADSATDIETFHTQMLTVSTLYRDYKAAPKPLVLYESEKTDDPDKYYLNIFGKTYGLSVK